MLPPKGLTLSLEYMIYSYLRAAQPSPWATKEGFRIPWLMDLPVKVFSEGGGLEVVFFCRVSECQGMRVCSWVRPGCHQRECAGTGGTGWQLLQLDPLHAVTHRKVWIIIFGCTTSLTGFPYSWGVNSFLFLKDLENGGILSFSFSWI